MRPGEITVCLSAFHDAEWAWLLQSYAKSLRCKYTMGLEKEFLLSQTIKYSEVKLSVINSFLNGLQVSW